MLIKLIEEKQMWINLKQRRVRHIDLRVLQGGQCLEGAENNAMSRR
jgi:hypothetical protein